MLCNLHALEMRFLLVPFVPVVSGNMTPHKGLAALSFVTGSMRQVKRLQMFAYAIWATVEHE